MVKCYYDYLKVNLAYRIRKWSLALDYSKVLQNLKDVLLKLGQLNCNIAH